MQICHITIYTGDMEASLHFYHNILNIPINHRFPMGTNGEICFLGSDQETLLEIIHDVRKANPAYGQDISIGFKVDSIADKAALLAENGFPMLGDIIRPNPHTAFFFVNDPNGLRVQFMQG